MTTTLLDIAKMNGSDSVAGLIDETTKAHPEFGIIDARSIRGTQYKTLVRTKLPTVGFRNANEGSPSSSGEYANGVFETFIANPRWDADKAVADGHEDGAAAYIALEASGIMEAVWQLISSQFYYGTGLDPKGFPGLIASYDSNNMVVDAGGTAASTGSSVWAVKHGPKDARFILGNNATFDVTDPRIRDVTDANGNEYTAYFQEMLLYIGLQVASTKSVARIKKLTEEAGKTLTDDMIAKLLSRFPANKKPDVLFMNTRSLEQLRSSRTATTATGAPAPIPTEAFTIPISVTDSIIETEDLAL